MSFNSIPCQSSKMIPSFIIFIVLFSCFFGHAQSADQFQLGAATLTGDNTFTLSSFSYPPTTLRPFDLRYIRVDLPQWFSTVSVALISDVHLDSSGIEKVPQSSLPLICLRDGSPPLPDVSNTSLKEPLVSGIKVLDVEQCFLMQQNITLKLTNEQISPGAWYLGLFNGIGASRTQSKMIIRGPAYSFTANISVEACTDTMTWGQFCNDTVYPLACSASGNYSSSNTKYKPADKNMLSCTNNFNNACLVEDETKVYSLDILSIAEEFTITASNVSFSGSTSAKSVNATDINLMCFVRHGAIASANLHDYSGNINKGELVIRLPMIGRWYITIVPVNVSKEFGGNQDMSLKVCYSMQSHLLECPMGKSGLNCTLESYILQTVLRRGSTPFESYYLPVSEKLSFDSADFTLEPLLSNNSYDGSADYTWTYFLLDIPKGAAGGNIRVRVTSDSKIEYEIYAKFGGLPSLDCWDYYYANKTSSTADSSFFMLYDSNERSIDFYIIYAREGAWGFGLRHLSNSSASMDKTVMSLSLERCPKRCSSHGECKFSFDASGLTSYSFCACDRNHGGFDCGIEIVSHQGHIKQSVFLIASNAAAVLPAIWALRKKAMAEWVIYTSSGISSALYHACDVGTWCPLNYNVLQFLDFWLSFMAVISTFIYLATIDEVHKRAIHAAVTILTALMAATKATRSSNIVLVIAIGAVGLFLGWLIELSTHYRSFSFSIGFSLNMLYRWQNIKRWLHNLMKTIFRLFRWGFLLAGFLALAVAAISWTLESSDTYWIWHSIWHMTIYTSSFFFLCSKAKRINGSEDQRTQNQNYELTRQNSLPRGS